MLVKLASFCYRRRRIVLVLWIVAFLAIGALSSAKGSAYSQSFTIKGTDSQQATDLLSQRFPARSGATGDVVFKVDAGVADPSTRATLTTLFDELRAIPNVADVRSPYDPGGERQIGADGQLGFAEVQFDVDFVDLPKTTVKAVEDTVIAARQPGLQLELGGSVFQERKPPGGTELVGLIAAAVILLLAFGSLLAMGLPIATALFGVGIGLSLVQLLGHVMSVPEFATQLGAMIGIGVGIDYALFIVTRYRSGLQDGLGPHAAVVNAINTSGRAVLFAGTTVVISLAGMLLIGLSFVQGLGLASALVVLVTMLASITLLPAILGFVGTNIDRLSLPFGRGRPEGHRTIWDRWSGVVERHPWPIATIGLLVLLALAMPILSLRLGSSDESNLPTSQTVRRAFDLKADAFGPGASAPLLLVAELPSGADASSLTPVVDAVSATPGVAQVSPPTLNPAGDTAVIRVVPTTSGQDAATTTLLKSLRTDVLPRATQGTGVQVYVGGVTALFEDLAQQLQDRLPIFIGAVLGLSFLLLLVVFRSILVPVKAVLMNLLSIGAAYGLIVAVFQWGWGKNLLGVGNTGPIESFLPMMMFAILFGLSMDYEVFLLSRIKEEYDRTGDNSKAVADGLSATARVITAAALIMVAVFGSFVFGDQRVVKSFGLGLAAAVLIDATIVRIVLVPATMELLGNANWWFPRWLRWLPVIHVDAEVLEADAEAAIALDRDPHDRDSEPRAPAVTGRH